MRHGSKLPTRKRSVIQREGVIKIGPNESCPCGSGEKFKKCCDAAGGLFGWWRRRKAYEAKRQQLIAEHAARNAPRNPKDQS